MIWFRIYARLWCWYHFWRRAFYYPAFSINKRWQMQENASAQYENRSPIQFEDLCTTAYEDFFDPFVLWCQYNGYDLDSICIDRTAPMTFEQSLSAPLPPPYTGFANIDGKYYPFWSK